MPQTPMETDPNQRANTIKIQNITEISAVLKKYKKNSLKILKMTLETETVAPKTLSQTAMQTRIIVTTTTETVTELKGSQKLFTNPVRNVERQTTPQRNAATEPMQRINRLLGTEARKDRNMSKKDQIKMTPMKLLRLQPTIYTKNATFSLRSCDWQIGDYWTSTNPSICLAATPGDSFSWYASKVNY